MTGVQTCALPISSPQHFFSGLIETMVHEVAHIAAWHLAGGARRYDPAFLESMSLLTDTLAPVLPKLQEELENEATKQHSPNPIGSLVRDLNKVRGEARRAHSRASREAGRTGPAIGATGEGRNAVGSGLGLESSGDADFDAGRHEGLEPATVQRVLQDPDQGDYPPASPEIRNWEAKQRSEATGEPHLEDKQVDPESQAFLEKAGEHLDSEGKKQVQDSVVHYNKLLGNIYTVVQLMKQNMQIPGNKVFLRHLEDMQIVKTRVTKVADDVMRKWNLLGKSEDQKLSRFTEEARERSHALKRRLTPEELAKLGKKYEMGPGLMHLYVEVDNSLKLFLSQMRQAGELAIRRDYPELAFFLVPELNKEFAKMGNRNFFPFMRFGRNIVAVETTGKTIYGGKSYGAHRIVDWMAFENAKDAMKVYNGRKKELGGKPLRIFTYYVPENATPYLSFPPMLFNLVRKRLNLTEHDEMVLRQLMYSLSPANAFSKHLMKTRLIAGFSSDFRRSYAAYMSTGANHIARALYSWRLQEDINSVRKWVKDNTNGMNAIKGGRLVEALQETHRYVTEPQNEWNNIRAMGFTYYFAGVPRMMITNFTQVPLLAFPRLAKLFAGRNGLTGRHIGLEVLKAAKDVTESMREGKRLTPDERRAMHWLEGRDLLTESYAATLAAVREGGLIHGKLLGGSHLDYTIRQMNTFLVSGFALSEEWNRRVTALATYRVAQQAGESPGRAREHAVEVIRDSQFEYQKWNRPPLMRGKKSILFLFKLWPEHYMYYVAHNLGGWRFWAMALSMGGLKMIPFAEDATDLIDMLVTGVRKWAGKKHPYFDAEKELREMSAKVGISGDTLVNGLSSNTFGLTALTSPFGIPLPALDISATIQVGKQLPELVTLAKALRGDEGPSDAVLDLLAQTTGVAGRQGIDLLRASFADTPARLKALRLAPMGLRNMLKAYFWITHKAMIDSRGNKLLDVNLSDPAQIGEVVGQLMGFTPTRLSAYYDARTHSIDEAKYYAASREAILTYFRMALQQRDREGTAEARRRVRAFNKQAPRGLAISAKDIIQSVRSARRTQGLREMGLPPQRRYWGLYREMEKAFEPGAQLPRGQVPAQSTQPESQTPPLP